MFFNEKLDLDIVSSIKKMHEHAPGSDGYIEHRNNALEKSFSGIKKDIPRVVMHWNLKHKIDIADAESLVYENVMTAVQLFDANKCNRFSPFFTRINMCRFKNYLTHHYAQKRTPQVKRDDDSVVFQPVFNLDSPADNNARSPADEAPHSLLLEEVLRDGKNFVDTYDQRQSVLEVYKKCDSLQKRILKRLYFGKTKKDVCQRLKISIGKLTHALNGVRNIAEEHELS